MSIGRKCCISTTNGVSGVRGFGNMEKEWLSLSAGKVSDRPALKSRLGKNVLCVAVGRNGQKVIL